MKKVMKDGELYPIPWWAYIALAAVIAETVWFVVDVMWAL